MKTMNPEGYTEREVEVSGWQVRLTTYKLGAEYFCKADNISPGAWLARAAASTREEAEEKALAQTRRLLSRSRRHQTAA
jgi:nitrogen fixation protein FixH